MNKFKKLLIPLLILLVVFCGIIYFGRRIAKDLSHASTSPSPAAQEIKANLTVMDGENQKSFDIGVFVGKTALEATQTVLDGQIVTKGTGTNAFITSLEGRAADSAKHEFWELDVNGAQTQVGAGSYIIQSGDQVVWKIGNY